MEVTKLDSILFNPLSWIHPQRFTLPLLFNTPRCRSLINDAIIEYYHLPMTDVNLTNGTEKFLIENWKYLAQALFMIACLRKRNSLLYCGQWLSLPKSVREFALLDIIEIEPGNNERINNEDLWQIAFHALIPFISYISKTIAARLPLLFANATLSPGTPIPSPTDRDHLLLRLAVQYAKQS